MKPRIVADGEWRLRRSPEFQARLRELRESIQARNAAELAQAGFFQRLLLHWRIAAEFRRERRKIEPSPGSLYTAVQDAGAPQNTPRSPQGLGVRPVLWRFSFEKPI